MEHYRDNRGSLFWIQPIPGDGDCLFGALACQLFRITPKHWLFKEYSHQLRQLAVAEIERNYLLYEANIERFAKDLIDGDEPLRLKAARYLDYLRCPGFWGGTECLSALVNRIGFNLLVHQPNSCIRYEPQCPTGELPTYHVLFREDHYDSVICKRPATFKLMVPDFVPNYPVFLRESGFEAQVCYLTTGTNALISAIGHQLTGTVFDEDHASRLRTLIADEIETLPVDDLAKLGIPCYSTRALTEFTSHLRDGRITGGESILVLLSAVLGITIFVHSPTSQTYRLDPAYRNGAVAIHLLIDEHNRSTRYASVISLRSAPSRPTNKPPTYLDPLPAAGDVARADLSQITIDFSQGAAVRECVGLRVASLNINGCRTSAKRDAVDLYLAGCMVDVALLQEVNLDSAGIITTNYRWYTGDRINNKKRGLAVLCRKSVKLAIEDKKNIGPNLLYVKLHYQV